MTTYKRKRIKTGSETFTTITTNLTGGKRISYTHKSRGVTRTKSHSNKAGTRNMISFNLGDGWIKRFTTTTGTKPKKRRKMKYNSLNNDGLTLFLWIIFIVFGTICIFY